MNPLSAPRRSAWVLLAALALVALTARLGVWQLDRGEAKRALQARMAQQGALAPLGTADLAGSAEALSAQAYRRIRLQGTWLPESTRFLDNRQMGGHPGFFVVSALRLPDGSAVLVQRGWVPRDARDRTRLPALPPAQGPAVLDGRVVPWPSALAQLGAESPGPIRQNVDLAGLTREWGLPLRPLSVQQTGAAEGPLLRDWPEPALDVRKHDLYAAQWFSFSLLTVGLYVWFQLLRPWRGRAVRGLRSA